jgi:pro-apoptotic serine protease NMA111
MPVCETVLPEGPAYGKLQEGDVLLKVDGQFLTPFIRLDKIMDASVGKPIRLLVQRYRNEIAIDIQVGNLHAITPDRFVAVAGGSFQELSYQLARWYVIPVKGVYLCYATGSFKLASPEDSRLFYFTRSPMFNNYSVTFLSAQTHRLKNPLKPQG